MSLNKVLNRPMFRREALRKGVLKPIRAKVGIYAGPGYKQGPNVPDPYEKVYIPEKVDGKRNYSKFPSRSFNYDPLKGEYVTEAGKYRMGRGIKGLGGLYALYKGAEMAGIPDPILQTAGFAELASIPFGMAKSPSSRMIGKMLGSGVRLSANNPMAALGIGTALAATGGAKAYYDETKMVKDYARANNIDYKKALDIFNRDLSFGGGRPMTTSDIGKAVIATSSARDLVKGGLDKTPEGPPGSPSYEQRVAAEMRNYMKQSKTYGRYLQDVDQLVKKVKDKQRAYSMAEETASMSPDDAMQFDQVGGQIDFQEKIATVELRNALMAQKNLDINKASNLALAITGGEIEANDVDAIVKSDELYAQVPNNANDPNHPKFIKEEKTVEQINKKNNAPNIKTDGISTEKTTGTSAEDSNDTILDPEIKKAKDAAKTIDMTQFLKADPRNTQMDPNRVMLMKLAAGLLSGKSMQGGLAGAAEIFGAALGPAIDAKVLVKMKNDEAYRDWASTVLSYNSDLIEARNKMLKDAMDAGGKIKRQRGSISMGGKYYEAFQNKDTAQIYIFDPVTGEEKEVSTVDATFFPEQDSAAYVDNLRLVADGAMAAKTLKEQIALMQTPEGKTAIGASGIILRFVETIGNIPSEISEGFRGSVGNTFSQSGIGENEKYTNAKGIFSKETFNESTTRILDDFTKATEEFMAKNPDALVNTQDGPLTASEVLGKLQVNARMLTYTLANALKDKDRLTNRDLELIEQLTGTLSAEPDEKIIQKYQELLKRVEEKNAARLSRFYQMGNTPNDVLRIIAPIDQALGQGTAAPMPTTDDDLFKLFGVN
jgi:hypothetical protein